MYGIAPSSRKLQISPLRYAPVEMTKGRAVFYLRIGFSKPIWRCVTTLPFVISTGA
jgi:hypothetical protein